ncbi:hypothetical protein ND748_07705 [Frankia sp. AiPs1]|nr:hypothetical protein [Frankia sp. AiPs1]MCM3921550.1 hypothetical protein [Frankia sp. AiPs1]
MVECIPAKDIHRGQYIAARNYPQEGGLYNALVLEDATLDDKNIESL